MGLGSLSIPKLIKEAAPFPVAPESQDQMCEALWEALLPCEVGTFIIPIL